MKYLSILLLAFVVCSCGTTETNEAVEKETTTNTLLQLSLEDLSALKDVKEGNAVAQLLDEAKAESVSDKKLKKGNAEAIFSEIKAGKKALIFADNHTVAVITDSEDCKMSGSWGVCMPKAKGYVRKKGDLEKKKDYLNNIIGTPGSMEVRVYFF